MKRNNAWLVIPTLVSILISGCGKETAAPPISQSNPPPGVPRVGESVSKTAASQLTESELNGVPNAKKKYRLVLIVKTRNNPFFDPMIKAFEAEAKAMGCESEVQAPPQEGDKELQFSYVTNVIARGADAILIAPADSKAIVPALKQAMDKGILVVNIDNRVDSGSLTPMHVKWGGYVGANNEAGGKLAGEAMVKALGGSGKVAIIEGIRGADNAEARRRGFESGKGSLDVVAKESGEWNLDKANAKAQAILAAHPDITGIFCANDMMALGAIKAVKSAGKTGKVHVIGYDNIPAVKSLLANGEMQATIEQHPDLMGKFGVRMAVGVLDGGIPAGKEFLVPLEVVGK